MVYVHKFLSGMGLDEEDPSFIATGRLLDAVAASDEAELAFVIHSDEALDNNDCNFYDVAGLADARPLDILLDDGSLERAETSCRSIKQVIHFGLAYSGRFALMGSAIEFAGFDYPEEEFQNAIIESAGLQAASVYPTGGSEFVDVENFANLLADSTFVDAGWSEGSVSVDCFDTMVAYSHDGGTAQPFALRGICTGFDGSISKSEMLTSASMQAMADADQIGLVGVSTTGDTFYLDEGRYVIQRAGNKSEPSAAFTAQNFWEIVSAYQIRRSELPGLIFE